MHFQKQNGLHGKLWLLAVFSFIFKRWRVEWKVITLEVSVHLQ